MYVATGRARGEKQRRRVVRHPTGGPEDAGRGCRASEAAGGGDGSTEDAAPAPRHPPLRCAAPRARRRQERPSVKHLGKQHVWRIYYSTDYY